MNINEMEILFKGYVDEFKQETENLNVDVKILCERHRIVYNDNITRYHVEATLKEKIQRILIRQGDLSARDFRKLKSHILLKYYGLKIEYSPYLEYIEFIISYCSNDTLLPNLINKGKWKELLLAVIDYISITNENYLNMMLPHTSTKEKNEGVAINFWIKRGYKINVNNGKVDIAEKDYERIGRFIDNYVSKIGGLNILNILLKETYFDKRFLRYRLIRNKSTLDSKINSSIPFGYLFNLSVKHFDRKSKLKLEEHLDEINELFEMARHYIALLQLQTYSSMSDIFLDHETVTKHIYENTLYDYIFLYKQFNPRFIPRMIRGMLTKYYDSVDYQKVFKGLKFEEIISVINYILNHPSQSQSFRKFTVNSMCNAFPKLSELGIEHLLNLFAHKETPNKEFYYPNSNSNYDKYPLLLINNEYILIDRTLNAFSFFDCLCDILRREYGKNFDNDLGLSLEDYLKELLNKNNVKYSNGYYNENEECDIVIETLNYIFLLEVKKKPLTKKSLTGDGITLFSDISKSIIDSQIQLGKHQLNLMKNQKIDLYSKRGKVKKNSILVASVPYNERIIERISVNLNDYGILSDKMFVQEILQFLTGADLQAIDTIRNSELNEVRKKNKKLLEQYNEFCELNLHDKSYNVRKAYFHTSFMSLQMLMTRLENISSNDEFENDYRKNKFITMSTGDSFFEYFHVNDFHT